MDEARKSREESEKTSTGRDEAGEAGVEANAKWYLCHPKNINPFWDGIGLMGGTL